MAEVLVELPNGQGVIRHADREIALTHDVTREGGQTPQPWDRYQPLRIGLGDNRMLVGGLLPPGAARAEAVEATGVRKLAVAAGGVYAVIFEDGDHSDAHPLGYRDAAGAFVHRPMPGTCDHEPVADADVPCPVCDAVEYELFHVTEEWRAGRGRKGTDTFEPSPLVVCRVCGHQQHIGGIMRFGRTSEREDEDATAREARLARVRAEQEVQRWYADTMTLRGVAFPIYAAEGWPARIIGSGSQGDEITEIRIAHAEFLPDWTAAARARIQISTSVDPHRPGELAIARETYGQRIEVDNGWPSMDDLSDAAVTLRFRASARRRIAAAHQAPEGEVDIMIDGASEPFVSVGHLDGLWVGVRRYHDVTITITARQTEPGALVVERIADPSARLLGPEPE